MTETEPEVTARIRLFSKQEGNPKHFPICPPVYECPMYYNEQYYDCRLMLEEYDQPLELGTSFDAPVRFSWPQAVFPKLKAGDSFCLWEDGIIGEGKVVEINDRGTVYHNIRRTFSHIDLKIYNELCREFSGLTSAKNNSALWNELEKPGPLLNVLDAIHDLRDKYGVIIKGHPFYYIWIFDPTDIWTPKACEKKKLEKSWG